MDTEALKQILAAQGGGLNPAAQELLQQSAGTGTVTQDPQALLATLAHQHPAAAALMQMMLARRTPPAPISECVVIDGIAQEISAELVEELKTNLDARGEEIARLTTEIQSLTDDIQLLQDRSDLLADALGACALCWGQDSHCPACRGHGLPGRSIPDQQLFEEYVLPAVRLMRASQQRASAVTPLSSVANRPAAEPAPIRQISQ